MSLDSRLTSLVGSWPKMSTQRHYSHSSMWTHVYVRVCTYSNQRPQMRAQSRHLGGNILLVDFATSIQRHWSVPLVGTAIGSRCCSQPPCQRHTCKSAGVNPARLTSVGSFMVVSQLVCRCSSSHFFFASISFSPGSFAGTHSALLLF